MRLRWCVFLLFLSVFVMCGLDESSATQPFNPDPESTQCLSCHDAAMATDATLTVCPEPECDHPIAVNYANLSARNHGLRPVNQLNPAIRLVQGNKVGCGSCHIPYDTASHWLNSSLRNLYPSLPDPMLVMDNRASELCLGCHIK